VSRQSELAPPIEESQINGVSVCGLTSRSGNPMTGSTHCRFWIELSS